MQANFLHNLYSSFYLYLDHQIVQQGQSYTNYSGLFYPVRSNIQGLYAYNCGFRQIVSDTSITGGCNVMTGVYLNGNYINIGTSGLVSINHSTATVYFNSPIPQNVKISGKFAIKDFNLEITDEQEYNILFNTEYQLNPKFTQTISGLDPAIKVSPVIFLKFDSAQYKPFAFSRIDDQRTSIRCSIITDTEYERVGLSYILQGLHLNTFPIITSTPFDSMGNFTGTLYNFDSMTNNTIYQPWIIKSQIVDLPKRPFTEPSRLIGRKIFIADIDISTLMGH